MEALTEHVYWASRYTTPKNAEDMQKAAAIFDKQRRTSGKLSDLFIKERDIWEDYSRLWELFSTYYHKAREARIESAEPVGD